MPAAADRPEDRWRDHYYTQETLPEYFSTLHRWENEDVQEPLTELNANKIIQCQLKNNNHLKKKTVTT